MSIYSTIPKAFLKRLLIRAMLLGSLGLATLCTSIWVPRELLRVWGLPIFSIGMCLITIGFLPYKRASARAISPYSIHIQNHVLFFCKENNQTLLSLPIVQITHLRYVESPWRFGIEIDAEDHGKIFLPYFSTKGFQKLLKGLKEEYPEYSRISH